MFTIEAERDGLKEQTLKKSIPQGKIRLTVKKKKKGGGGKESKERDVPSQEQTLQEKKSIIRYVEKHIFRIYIQ